MVNNCKRNFVWMQFLMLTLASFSAALAYGQDAPRDTLVLRQIDGTKLTIIGYGQLREAYTETIDGYTITLDEHGIYQYAKIGTGGGLATSGFKARDPQNRTKDEIRFLRGKPTHLRPTEKYIEQLRQRDKKFYDHKPIYGDTAR